MATEPWTVMAFDPIVFERNNRQFPASELVPYWGPHVAWSLEGTRILADGATSREAWERAREAGFAVGTFVTTFVHDPNVSYIGWCSW